MKEFTKFEKAYRMIMEDIYDYNYGKSNELSDNDVSISVKNNKPVKPGMTQPVNRIVKPAVPVAQRTLKDAITDITGLVYDSLIYFEKNDIKFFNNLIESDYTLTNEELNSELAVNSELYECLNNELEDAGFDPYEMDGEGDQEEQNKIYSNLLDKADIKVGAIDVLISELALHCSSEEDTWDMIFSEQLSQEQLSALENAGVSLDNVCDTIWSLAEFLSNLARNKYGIDLICNI